MDKTSLSKRTWTIEANVAKKKTKIRGWSNQDPNELRASDMSMTGSQPEMTADVKGPTKLLNVGLRKHDKLVEKILNEG